MRRSFPSRSAAVALAALALSFTVTWFVHPWSDESVGDLAVRSTYAALVLDGELPYRDFAFEYPPLAAPAIALPGLAGTGEDAYRLGIALFTFAVTAAVLILAGALAARTGGSARIAMAAVAVSPLLLGAVTRLHFDPVPVALTLAALLALVARRPALGLALVGIGAMIKGFPMVVAPVALAWLWWAGDRRGAMRGAGALAATLAVLCIGWLAVSPGGAIESLEYQLDRPVQLESSPGSVLFAAGALGGQSPWVVASHGSAGLVHPLDGPVGLVFAVFLGVALVVLTAATAAAAAARRPLLTEPRTPRRPPVDPVAARALVLGAVGAIMAFVAFGRVLSPQYLVWLVPLLALSAARRMRALAGLTAAACALTLAEFPSRYLDLVRGEQLAVTITAARNAALVVAVVLSGAALWRMVKESSDEAVARHAVSPAPPAPARSIAPARPASPR